MGCPQCSPQPSSRGVSAPDLQLASHQGKTESFPSIITLPTATGSLGKQKICHSSQKSMATWAGHHKHNPSAELSVWNNLKSLRVVTPLEGWVGPFPPTKAPGYFPVLVESLTLGIQRKIQCTDTIEMLV